jgi:hypothetical protein
VKIQRQFAPDNHREFREGRAPPRCRQPTPAVLIDALRYRG